MWQVSGRSDITDFEEVVRLDKEYITNPKSERQASRIRISRPFPSYIEIISLISTAEASKFRLLFSKGEKSIG